MKKILFATVLLLSGSLFAQKQFTIKGDVSKVKNPVYKIYLSYYADGAMKSDSTIVTDGKYAFNGNLSKPLMASLRASYVADTASKGRKMISFKRDVVQFFLENSKISINSVDSFGNATVKGSKAELENQKLKESTKELNEQISTLSKEYSEMNKKKDEAGMKRVDEEYEKVDAQIRAKYKEYVLANPKSVLALHAVSLFAGYDINAEEVEPVFLTIPASTRNSAEGKEMAEKIETAKKTGVGVMAMDFTQNDTLGNPVTLSSFRGKYLLVDFWASWCGPCRAENPNVVAAFNKYNQKGFNILGVSLDQPNAKDKWLKAIHDDKLTWTQVSDLKYWKNEVAVQYGIQAIPQNFLIDPSGKIIGKNLRGEALNKKLEEIFK